MSTSGSLVGRKRFHAPSKVSIFRKSLGRNRYFSTPPLRVRVPVIRPEARHVNPMKSLFVALAFVPLLLAAPTALAQAHETVLLCTGLVCDLICDTYNWIGAHPWFDWIASNPILRIGRYCPIA